MRIITSDDHAGLPSRLLGRQKSRRVLAARDHWRRMRTADFIERAIQQELKRRSRRIRVFPNDAFLERLATAILVEID